jgi:hypothetical protein
MMVDDDFIALKSSFLKHVSEKVLIDVVVQVLYRYFDGGRFSNIVFID